MKKRISILFLLCSALFAGCDETVTMDGSVGARVDAVIKGYIADLAAAPNGWIAEVPTSEGVYRFHMAFTDDNKVTMYTDNLYYPDLNGVPKQSTYNIRSLQRPTLSFDTYSYLAIINDPNDEISHGSGNMGLETDFEFEVDRVENGVYYLTGRVNRVAATLRRATPEEEQAVKEGGLMEVLQNAIAYKQGDFCYFMAGETQVGVAFNSRSVNISYVSGDEVVQQTQNTRTQLDYNIELLEPVTVGDTQVTGFVWDEASQSFSAAFGGEQIAVESQTDPIIPLHLMLGPGRNYTTLASLADMYPSYDPSVNELGYLYAMTYNALASQLNMPLNEVDMEFYTTEGGSPRISMMMLVGRYQGWATFNIEYNDAGDEFTVKDLSFEDDAHGNGAYFYELGAYQLVDYFVGKTFRIEWSHVAYGSYSMGQLTLVGGEAPGVFYGACF